MATETVIPDQSTKDQHVDNTVNEEIKAVDHETTPPSEENGAGVEVNQKTYELAKPEASITELEKEDEQVDMPAVVADENSHVLELPTVDVPKATDHVNISDASIPVVEAVEKESAEHINVTDVPIPEADTIEKPIEVVPHIPAPEAINPVTEAQEVDRPAEVVPLTPAPEEVIAPIDEAKEDDKHVEVTVPLTAAPQEVIPPAAEAKEVDKPVEAVSLIAVPEEVIASVAEDKVVDIPVEVVPLTPAPEEVIAPVTEDKSIEVVTPTPAPEELIAPIEAVAVDKPIEEVPHTSDPKEVPESEAKSVEQPEPSVAVVEKTPEQSEITKEVETRSDVDEPKEVTGNEDAKDGESLVKKAEEVIFSPFKEQTMKDSESSLSKNVDTVVTTNQEAPSDPIDGQVSVILDVADRVGVVDPKKEESQGDVAEGLVGEAILEAGNVETERVDKKEEVEESKRPEATKTEVSTEVTHHASRDPELVPEEKLEESVKEDVKPSVEAIKDTDIDEKEESVTDATTANEPVAIPKELVLEEKKTKDTVDPVVDKLENAAELVEDISKSDAPNMESSKDVADARTGGEAPKEEVPVKTTRKHSKNILSKVKQSIVKVKKAIVDKSPRSKIISSNAKDDIQVK